MSNNKSILSQSGQKIIYPDKFDERYDSTLNIRKYGIDNLYPQHLRTFLETSGTLNSCVLRLKDFLYGEGTSSTILSNDDLSMILYDYALFNGFALFVQYNGLGDMDRVNYIPFETIRLGEQGSNGKYTYCYYNPDWSFNITINKKKIKKDNSVRYFMFTDDIETRLNRMQQETYNGGEVLYFSNTLSYPRENVRSCINYISAEVGISNILYRDVRTSFLQNSVLAIPRQSDDDSNEFINQLEQLQGDLNSYKILTVEFSSNEDKPEVLNLNSADYTDRVIKVAEQCKNNIIRAYNQEAFIRLEEGSLGFGSDAISSIYAYYNRQLRSQRKQIENCLKRIDPIIELKEISY